MEHVGDGDTNSNWCTRYRHQRICTRTGDLEIRGRVETIQSTALLRSAKIVRRFPETWGNFTVTQTPMRNYLLTLVWKTLKMIILIIIIIIAWELKKTTDHCNWCHSHLHMYCIWQGEKTQPNFSWANKKKTCQK